MYFLKLDAVKYSVSVASSKLCKVMAHRVVPQAQVSVILRLQYQFCALCLSLTLPALKKSSAGKYKVHKSQREPQGQKTGYIHTGYKYGC